MLRKNNQLLSIVFWIWNAQEQLTSQQQKEKTSYEKLFLLSFDLPKDR